MYFAAGSTFCQGFQAKLTAAGFEQAGVEPTRVYRIDDARELLAAKGIDVDAVASDVDGKFMSAFIRATKPNAKASSCCS